MDEKASAEPNFMPYYVYILECKNKALYTGITIDIQRRLKEHQTGRGGHYTSYNPGVKMILLMIGVELYLFDHSAE